MNELNQYLSNIKQEKDEKLIPENIKKDVTVFGVTGTLEVGAGGAGKYKVFADKQAMEASTGNQDKDIALVCGIEPIQPEAGVPFMANTLVLSEEIPKTIDFTELSKTQFTATESKGRYFNMSIYGGASHIGLDFNGNGGGLGEDLYYDKTGKLLRQNYYGYALPAMYYIDNLPIVYEQVGADYHITGITINDPSADIWNYIKFAYINTVELYYYDGPRSKWVILNNSMKVNASQLVAGKTVLGANGLVTGTLDLSASKNIISIPAYSKSAFSSTQSDMSIGEPDTYMMIDATDAPTGLGDKRWVMLYGCVDMMMGAPNYHSIVLVLPDDANILYNVKYETYERLLGNYPDYSEDWNTELKGYQFTNMTARVKPSIEDMINLKPCTGIATSMSNVSGVATYSGAGGLYEVKAMATNAEIRDIHGNILRAAGQSAKTTPVGQYYYNIFGEKVIGTYTPSYDDTITPEELTIAINTADNILGTEDSVIPGSDTGSDED